MIEQTTTIQQFINKHELTMQAERTDRNPHMEHSAEMDHWECIINSTHGEMTVVFSLGKGHHGRMPTLADVLDCLASDVNGIEGFSFEEWADNYGYDTDSRKAEKTYHFIIGQMRELRRLLGPDAYLELLHNVERL